MWCQLHSNHHIGRIVFPPPPPAPRQHWTQIACHVGSLNIQTPQCKEGFSTSGSARRLHILSDVRTKQILQTARSAVVRTGLAKPFITLCLLLFVPDASSRRSRSHPFKVRFASLLLHGSFVASPATTASPAVAIAVLRRAAGMRKSLPKHKLRSVPLSQLRPHLSPEGY